MQAPFAFLKPMQISPEVAALLNRQINAETYAAQIYYAVHAWANSQAYPGLEAFALAEAQDEEAHARHFLAYANERGKATIQAVAQPPGEFDGYAGAITSLLIAERAVTAALAELHAAAMAASDAATCLIASQQLLNEQVPAEHRLEVALMRVQRGAPIDLLDAVLWEE